MTSKNKAKGNYNETIVSNYFGMSRTGATGAGTGDSDIIDKDMKLVIEVKSGQQIPKLVIKAMQQAEETAEKYGFVGVSAFVPDGVGDAKFPTQGIILMRPEIFLELLSIRRLPSIDNLDIKLVINGVEYAIEI